MAKARYFICLALGLWPCLGERSAQGVIFSDPGSTNATNTTSAGTPSGSGWDYQWQWGNYLGTPVAPNYFLSAKHLGQAASTINMGTGNSAVSLTLVGGIPDPNSDLELWKVSGTFNAFAPIYTAGSENTQQIYFYGRGRSQGTQYDSGNTHGWNYDSPDLVMRWGTNKVSGFYGYGTPSGNALMVAKFNEVGAGDYITNEGIITVGDSGGGVFVQEGGTWKLAGINSYLDLYTTSPPSPNLFNVALYDTRSTYTAGPFDSVWTSPSGSGTPRPGNMYFSRTSTETSWLNAVLTYWKNDAGGNWSSSANWTSGVPNGPGNATLPTIATFTSAISAPRTVNVDIDVTMGTLDFNSPHSYTLSGTKNVSLDTAGAGDMPVTVFQGNHTISAPLVYTNDAATFNIYSGASLSITGQYNNQDGRTMTKTGPGLLTISGTQNYGHTAIMNVNAGTMNLASDGTTNLTVNANGGTTQFAVTQHLKALNIGAGGVATLQSGANRALVTNALSINATGQLDLTTGLMVVQSDTANRASVLAAVTSQLASGYNAGAWNGYGINSSTAAADGSHFTSVGVMLNATASNNAIMTSIFGQTVDPNMILVRFTYGGDANLTGMVDSVDYALIDDGYNHASTGWFHGDFNYDGVINAVDYAIIDYTFLNQGSPLAAGMISQHEALFGDPYSEAFALLGGPVVVPEPASIALAALGLGSLIAVALRRRKAMCQGTD